MIKIHPSTRCRSRAGGTVSVTGAEVLFRSVGVACQRVRSLASRGWCLRFTAVNMECKPTAEMLDRLRGFTIEGLTLLRDEYGKSGGWGTPYVARSWRLRRHSMVMGECPTWRHDSSRAKFPSKVVVFHRLSS